MSAERARDLPGGDRAVYILGSGEGTESVIVSQMDDLESFGPFRRGAKEAFETAGVTHDDIDHVMFYDAFAHLPLYMLEDTGFACTDKTRPIRNPWLIDNRFSPAAEVFRQTDAGLVPDDWSWTNILLVAEKPAG